jgi:hypothetical protein
MEHVQLEFYAPYYLVKQETEQSTRSGGTAHILEEVLEAAHGRLRKASDGARKRAKQEGGSRKVIAASKRASVALWHLSRLGNTEGMGAIAAMAGQMHVPRAHVASVLGNLCRLRTACAACLDLCRSQQADL